MPELKLSERNIFISIAGLLFCFLAVRAAIVPLYFDELFTLNSYVKTGYLSPYNEFRAANNHLLNTFFTFISYTLFGESPLSLRLFNLLSFIPFAVYTFKLGNFCQSKYTRWALFIALLFPLHIIAYFSLSRGYGLGNCFTIISFYFLYKTFIEHQIRNVLLAGTFGFLALMSNFSLLLFFLIALGVLIINCIRNWSHYKSVKNVLLLSLFSIAVVVALKLVMDLLFYYKSEGELWWGTKELWKGTVMSLIGFIFEVQDRYYIIQGTLIVIMILLSVLFLVKDPILKKFNVSNLFFLILLLNIAGILLLSTLFDVLYPFQRTGMHFYIMFITAYCFGVDKMKFKKGMFLFLLPVLFIPYHFFSHLNLTYVSNWEMDNVPSKYIALVGDLEKSANKDLNSSIYIQGMGFGSWNHQVFCSKSVLPMALYNSKNPGKFYDYLIANPQLMDPIESLYTKIDCTSHTNYCLYQRKKEPRRALIGGSGDRSKRSVNAEYFDLLHISVDSLNSTSVFLNINAIIQYADFPFQANLVLSVTNKNTKEQIVYESLSFDNRDYKKPAKIALGRYCDDLPKDQPLEIVVFIYNHKLLNYDLYEFEAKAYRVTE